MNPDMVVLAEDIANLPRATSYCVSSIVGMCNAVSCAPNKGLVSDSGWPPGSNGACTPCFGIDS